MSSAETPLPGIADDPELLADFIVEAREHLAAIEQKVLRLDESPAEVETLHAIFRGFHTIKGVAGFLNLWPIQEVAHEIETALDLARNGKLTVNAGCVDVILASADFLRRSVDQLNAALGAGQVPEQVAKPAASLLESIRWMASGEASASKARGREEQAAERNAASTCAPEQSATGVAKLAAAVSERAPDGDAHDESSRSVKVDIAKLDLLIDTVGELVIAQSMIKHDPELGRAAYGLQAKLAQLERISADVQRSAMAMRMVPIGTLFKRMNRLVRDLSRQTGKAVQLETHGDETELDRNLVEQLADALMHMVRNSVDHGLEPAEQRAAAGKEASGRVILRAGHQGGCIQIEVSDDGKGLDSDAILTKAREKGLLPEKAELNETEVFNLIFHPGFSTAQKVTSVSGRGVGMDVVLRQIEKMRGKISIQSRKGFGTTFTLKLPLTLAIIDGLLVKVGSQQYVIPMFAVRELVRPEKEMLSTVQGKGEVALIRDRLLPVVRISQQFGTEPRSSDLCNGMLIVTESRGRGFCLAVDELAGKQEVVIKSLGETFAKVDSVAGGAILGNGRVGLILDPENLL